MTPAKDSILTRRMGAAALIVSGGVLLSRILGQVREMVFAAMLGADGITDQYVAAFRIPDFLNYLLAGGFLSITFIPIFSRYLADDDEEGGWRALTAIVRPIGLGMIVLVAIGWVAAPVVIDAIYPQFTAEQLATTVRLTRIVLPAQVFFVLGALFSAVQYAKGAFVVPTLAPVVYNAGIILGGAVYAIATGSPDPEGFVWGALGGAAVGNFALQWWGARRVGMRLTLGISWSSPVIGEYLKIALPLMIGQSIVVLDETFMSVFGDLVGDGSQTHLQYARRTMFVPVGVIAQAAGVAAYPFMARLFAEGRVEAMADTVDRALKWVLAISIGAAALIAPLTVPIVRVLFERVNFLPADTTATATALFFYAFAIPIWGGLQVLTRAFYATREMWTPVIIGSAATVVAIPLYVLLQRSLGLRGVAVASVAVLGLYTATLGVVWYRSQRPGRLAVVLDAAGRAVPPAIVAAGAATLVAWGLDAVIPSGFFGAALTLLVAAAAFGATALAVIGLLSRWFTGAAGEPDQAGG